MAPRGGTGVTGSQRSVQDPLEAMSLVTDDSLSSFKRKYFFPNELVVRRPSSTDRVHLPPTGFVGVYESSLRAGLRFPPAPELLEILKVVGICLSQLSHRAMSIVMGLVVLFRERGTRLTPEALFHFGSFFSGFNGRILFQSKSVILETKDPIRYWSVGFFYVKNSWELRERWGEPLPLPESPVFSLEDVCRALKYPDFRDLQIEVRQVSTLLTEERLRKVFLFTDPGRSLARRVKRSERRRSPAPAVSGKRVVPDDDCIVVSSSGQREKVQEVVPLREVEVGGDSAKRRRGEGVSQVQESQDRGESVPVQPDQDGERATSREVPQSTREGSSSRPSHRISVSEQALRHRCLGFTYHQEFVQQSTELLAGYQVRMEDWNTEFVRTKTLLSKTQSLYDSKCQEMEEMATELVACRAEMASSTTSLTMTRQQLEQAQGDLIETEIRLRESTRGLVASSQRVSDLEVEIHTLRSERTAEAAALKAEGAEDFRRSFEYRAAIREEVDRARDHIHQEVIPGIERSSYQDGFVRGFYKGVRALQRQTGVETDRLSPSQASEDSLPPSDIASDGDEDDDVVSGLLETRAEDEVDTIDV